MIKANYSQLVERISKATGLDIADIERRIDAKKAKLSDLISREGAAQIVAAELGVNFDNIKVKINELLVGMRKVTVVGKIIKIFPIKTFKTKFAESKVCSFLLADETANVRCVLWDTNHIKMIEEGKIKENDIVEIKDATVREGTTKELHLSSLSEFNLSTEIIENPVIEETIAIKDISELKENDKVVVRATVVQAFEPKFFNICPECGRKVTYESDKFLCPQHGFVIPKERALFNFVLDDGKENIRAIAFSEAIKKFFNITDEELKNLAEKRQSLLGKEVMCNGIVRMNKAFGNLELVVSDFEEADPEKLIQELTINR
ncbi:MAG: OB-fold nucleic acid binding domain-containing protein [Candidatus Pacearchaeota archaeon]